MIEIDPDPTAVSTDCPVRDCPCRALERSAAAWGTAAVAVSFMDDDADDLVPVIRLVPKPPRG